MDFDETLAQVLRFLAEKLSAAGDELEASTPLNDTFMVDSLAFMEVIMFLEEEFGLSLDRKDLDAFDSPAGIARLIVRKKEG